MFDPTYLNAKRAAAVAGFSVQMLDYLEREGVFERDQARTNLKSKSRHHGIRRRYTFRDLVVLQAINGLLAKGISVRRIKEAIEKFCRDPKFACDRSAVTYENLAVQYFVTDGTDIYFYRGGSELISLLEGQQAFLFVMDIEKIRNAVSDTVQKGHFEMAVSRA